MASFLMSVSSPPFSKTYSVSLRSWILAKVFSFLLRETSSFITLFSLRHRHLPALFAAKMEVPFALTSTTFPDSGLHRTQHQPVSRPLRVLKIAWYFSTISWAFHHLLSFMRLSCRTIFRGIIYQSLVYASRTWISFME